MSTTVGSDRSPSLVPVAFDRHHEAGVKDGERRPPLCVFRLAPTSPSGTLVACVGPRTDLLQRLEGFEREGLRAWRAARRSWSIRHVTQHLRKWWNAEETPRPSLAILYGHRMFAVVSARDAAVRPAVVTRPYFGEAFDEGQFALVAAEGASLGDAECLIALEPPLLSPIEHSIQSRFPDASFESCRRVVPVAAWSAGDWILRHAAHGPAIEPPGCDEPSLVPSTPPDPFGRASDLLAMRLRSLTAAAQGERYRGEGSR